MVSVFEGEMMTDEEQVKLIVEKYNKSISDLDEQATAKEFQTVFKYIADQANERQREIPCLDDEDKKEKTK